MKRQDEELKRKNLDRGICDDNDLKTNLNIHKIKKEKKTVGKMVIGISFLCLKFDVITAFYHTSW
jgi:hypothetical protein